MRRKRHEDPPVSFFCFQDIITSVSGILLFLVILMALQLASERDLGSTVQSAVMRRDRSQEIAELRDRVETLRGQEQDLASSNRPSNTKHALQHAAIASSLKSETQRLNREVSKLRSAAAAEAKKRKELDQALSLAQSQFSTISNEVAKLQAAVASASKAVAFIPERPSVKRPILVECNISSIRCGGLLDSRPPIIFSFDNTSRNSAFADYLKNYSPLTDYFVLLVRPDGVETYLTCMKYIVSNGFDIGWDALEGDRVVSFDGGSNVPSP